MEREEIKELKKKKPCNQLFVKDIYRDKNFAGTVKCICCGEESSLMAKFPFDARLFSNFLKSFVGHHKNKGCNKIQLPAPEWASTNVHIAIV